MTDRYRGRTNDQRVRLIEQLVAELVGHMRGLEANRIRWRNEGDALMLAISLKQYLATEPKDQIPQCLRHDADRAGILITAMERMTAMSRVEAHSQGDLIRSLRLRLLDLLIEQAVHSPNMLSLCVLQPLEGLPDTII